MEQQQIIQQAQAENQQQAQQIQQLQQQLQQYQQQMDAPPVEQQQVEQQVEPPPPPPQLPETSNKMFEAIEEGDSGMVLSLLEEGENPNSVGDEGRTPVMHALD
jgi:type II secretory pathway pseudopilin PulG